MRILGEFKSVALFTFIGLLASIFSAAQADDETSTRPKTPARIWTGLAPTKINSASGDANGGKWIAGTQFANEAKDLFSIRMSAARFFDSSRIIRHNLLVHTAYRLSSTWEAGLIGGIGIMDPKNASGTFLKPVIGAEILWKFVQTDRTETAVFASVESVRGSTGTIALNGGPDDFSSTIVSLGITLSLAIGSVSEKP